MAYYDIKVDDDLIDKQVDMFASRAGSYAKADVYDPEQRDVLKGDLRELDANGNTLEGGITLSDESLMPVYFDDGRRRKSLLTQSRAISSLSTRQQPTRVRIPASLPS